MYNTLVKLIDPNVDGNGTDVEALIEVSGREVTLETIDDIQAAVRAYREENDGEWDSDGCFETVTELLEKKGYEVYAVSPSLEITLR